MKKCGKCDEYIFTWEKHFCEPFEITNTEDGDISIVHAKCEEDAIEKYATEYNESGDYPLMNGSTLKLKVNDATYEVGAEASIEYSVNEVGND